MRESSDAYVSLLKDYLSDSHLIQAGRQADAVWDEDCQSKPVFVCLFLRGYLQRGTHQIQTVWVCRLEITAERTVREKHAQPQIGTPGV